VEYFTAPPVQVDYRRSCFFIPRTGERLSSFPLAAFFCRLIEMLVCLAALAAVAAGLAGCSDRSQPATEQPTPVLVLGIDGLEWDVLGPLVKAGEMPHFGELMEAGQFGLLETTRPTFSPIIWTTMATGKAASQHGIRGFVKRRGRAKGEKKRLYNSLDRRTKAFWNILSDYGRSAAVVGWWMTFPAEPIEGVMIAQVNTLDQARRRHGEAILKGGLQAGVAGQVHPPERAEEILRVHDRLVDEMPERVRAIFGDAMVASSPFTERLWENTQWAFRADAVYVEVAVQLAGEGHDLVVCYLGGADVTGHRFWRHMRPEQFANPPEPAEIEAFSQIIPDYYRFLDQALGRLRAAMPQDTNVLVITDHGMGPVNRDAEFPSDDLPGDINSGHHHGAKPGVVVVSGPGFSTGTRFGKGWRKKDLPVLGSVFDVTPTLLTLLGIPVGEDMKGEVMEAVILPGAGSVPTHDSEEWLAARREQRGEQIEQDPERMRQLRALGYID
jgi:predicted AlkP superfamily phosphohydrolase/phosphomutase